MDSKIAKKIQSLTTAEEMRNQTKTVMQPYANWEEYLSSAPLSIAILGELVFISSKTDFSINKNPPKDGYNYIRYPESFRACLMQVCNSGWWAFSDAHKNMDQIRLYTASVPDYMKTAVKILFQGSNEVVEAHLPDQLKNIRTIADDCLALAIATEKRFTDVINIIQELLEACVNAEYFYGNELIEIKKRLEENTLKKASAEEAAKRSEKAVKDMEQQMKTAMETYNNAMNSMPSGWEMIGMDFVGAITESITVVIHGVTTAVTGNLGQKGVGIDNVDDSVVQINAYSKSVQILSCADRIQNFVKGDDIDWNNLYDQKEKAVKTDFSAQILKEIQSNLKEMANCKLNEHVQSLCECGINICSELAQYAPAGTCEPNITKQLIEDIRNFTQLARKFDSESKNATNSPPMVPKPPMMSKEENTSASQRASENARFRIEQSCAQLDKTREVYEKNMENMEKNKKELTDILIAMRSCELKEVDFKTTIEMLIKGMDAMGRVKEQWEKMVKFFQMVSTIVKVSLTRTLKDFVSTTKKTQALSYNDKLFCKDLLYIQAFQATNIASLVHMISATYTDVSNQYLMDRVSCLGKLLTMDKDNPLFLQERVQLQNTCDEAQRAISDLVCKNKAEFDKNRKSRVEKIENELLAILPAAAPEEIESIQAAVNEGFTADQEAQFA